MTKKTSESAWWSVSIELNFSVHQVILNANSDIRVELYRGDVVVEECETHRSWQTKDTGSGVFYEKRC